MLHKAMKRTCLAAGFLVILFCKILMPATVYGESLTLSWVASPEPVSGYIIHFGTTSRFDSQVEGFSYEYSVEVRENQSVICPEQGELPFWTYTVTNPVPGSSAIYYFTITTFSDETGTVVSSPFPVFEIEGKIERP